MTCSYTPEISRITRYILTSLIILFNQSIVLFYIIIRKYNVNYIGVKNLLAAINVNGVPKFVRITGSLCGKSCFLPFVALFNILLSLTAKWHERTEIAIRESGVDYTVLRPPGM